MAPLLRKQTSARPMAKVVECNKTGSNQLNGIALLRNRATRLHSQTWEWRIQTHALQQTASRIDALQNMREQFLRELSIGRLLWKVREMPGRP